MAMTNTLIDVKNGKVIFMVLGEIIVFHHCDTHPIPTLSLLSDCSIEKTGFFYKIYVEMGVGRKQVESSSLSSRIDLFSRYYHYSISTTQEKYCSIST